MISFLWIISRGFSSMTRKGPRPIVICGPSGSGKSTLLQRLFEEFPNTFGFSVSHTTRQPRPGEKNGVHYYFVSKEEIQKAIENDEFIETAEFGGNIYGTSKAAVKNVQNSGKACILDIDHQGVEQIRKTDLDPIYIFNNPPSIEELERRLRQRSTETEESLQKRLAAAKVEIDYGRIPGKFHKIIHNVSIDEAYKDFRDFIIKELKSQEANGAFVCWK